MIDAIDPCGRQKVVDAVTLRSQVEEVLADIDCRSESLLSVMAMHHDCIEASRERKDSGAVSAAEYNMHESFGAR